MSNNPPELPELPEHQHSSGQPAVPEATEQAEPLAQQQPLPTNVETPPISPAFEAVPSEQALPNWQPPADSPPQQWQPPIHQGLPPIPPPLPPQSSQPAPYAQPTQYGQPAQYAQQQPLSVPVQPHYPPVPAGWSPPPPAGGKIWLGILIGAGVPIIGFLLGSWANNSGLYELATGLIGLPFWLMLLLAIVLTVIRSQRRTGIGMWIGLAALPIVGFGACVVLIFGAGSLY